MQNVSSGHITAGLCVVSIWRRVQCKKGKSSVSAHAGVCCVGFFSLDTPNGFKASVRLSKPCLVVVM